MSDRMAAAICVGGKIKRCDLSSLAEAIIEQSFDDFESSEIDEVVADLTLLADNGEYFEGQDYEADWGEFVGLESKCQQLGLTYVRTSEPKYEYNGEYVYFSPDTGDLAWQRDAAGHIVFTADELENLFPANATPEQLQAGHVRLMQRLDVPECPPLEIID